MSHFRFGFLPPCMIVLLAFCPRSAAADHIGRSVVAYPLAGNPVSGRLLSVTDSTLTLQTLEGSLAIRGQDLDRVELLSTGSAGGRTAANAAILAGWVGVLLTARAQGNPTALLDGDVNAAAFGVLYLLGGGIGALLGYAAGGSETGQDEVITGFDRDPRRSLEHVRGHHEPRLRLGTAAAWTTTPTMDTAEEAFRSRGSMIVPGVYPAELTNEPEEAGHVNLLRRLDALLAVHPRLEVGAAVVWMGEANLFAVNPGAEAVYDSRGHYAMGRITLTPPAMNPRVTVGGGAGWTHMVFRMVADPDYMAAPDPDYRVDIDESDFGGYVVIGAEVAVSRWLAVGLQGDAAFGPEHTAPGDSAQGLPAIQVKTGNSSLGFQLSLHF